MKKKVLIPVVAAALVLCCAIGGTIAWLIDVTQPVTNTFTAGNIGLTLEETTSDYKMVPGNSIAKDPIVTVTDTSEDCYVFVKVEKSTNPAFDGYMTYEKADGWEELETGANYTVYFRTVLATDSEKSFPVLKDNQVTVKNTVTKDDMDALTSSGAALPTLTFTAYAVQKDGLTVQEAWAEAQKA